MQHERDHLPAQIINIPKHVSVLKDTCSKMNAYTLNGMVVKNHHVQASDTCILNNATFHRTSGATQKGRVNM